MQRPAPARVLARKLHLRYAALAVAGWLGGSCSSSNGQPPAGPAMTQDAPAISANPPATGELGSAAVGPPWGDNADFPYTLTNADEPYRGQFHFTAPAGWINDVNGVWYSGGLYHLAYQAYPYALEAPGDTKFWGHATSPDLVHWTHWPIMLHAGMNVPGSAWSGSTVVDSNNTSGFRTGTNPVFVSVYTATAIGTTVAYSNDLGVTWQPYARSPVSIGGPNANTRDPHVFWHAPSQKWVCVHYDGGVTIYTSPDLKTWTRTSHIDFGFECPDLYELPVDGNTANTRWVLQDASGAYLVGAFDGATFTPDGSGTRHMDLSSNFYAAQTFYRGTLPDHRVIQMAWIRAMDGATAPWNQSLSFPAELRLATGTDGIHVTRTPIAELSSLYGATRHWGTQVLAAGANPLQGVQGRTYDLDVVLDVAASAARTIALKIGSQTLTYDLAAHTLLGNPLLPVAGRVEIRVLVDWGQLEVFGNAGAFSYTAGVPFSASDTSLSLTGDGPVTLVSADFRTVHRTWPGNAAVSSAIIDDAASASVYTGTADIASENRYFGGSCRVLRNQGSSVAATFTGTRVDWWGLKNVDLGKADVYLDGVLVAAGIDCYSTTRQNARLFSQAGLRNATHTIKVVVSGSQNPASAGTALVHDYFVTYVDP